MKFSSTKMRSVSTVQVTIMASNRKLNSEQGFESEEEAVILSLGIFLY